MLGLPPGDIKRAVSKASQWLGNQQTKPQQQTSTQIQQTEQTPAEGEQAFMELFSHHKWLKGGDGTNGASGARGGLSQLSELLTSLGVEPTVEQSAKRLGKTDNPFLCYPFPFCCCPCMFPVIC